MTRQPTERMQKSETDRAVVGTAKTDDHKHKQATPLLIASSHLAKLSSFLQADVQRSELCKLARAAQALHADPQ